MKKNLFFALTAIMFAACAKDAIDEQSGIQPIVDDAPETLIVGFEGSDETRIQLNEATKTVWTKDDLVSVFYKSDANQKWQYQGETGERVGTLKRVDAGTATARMDRVVVAYPYSDDYLINLTTGDIEATMPATQTYLKDSYGLDGNIMVSSDYFTQISLKNVCGWLKLQLTGNGEKVKSITFKGNSGEQVAGLIYINTSDATAILASEMGGSDDGEIGGVGGSLVFDDTILTEVTLDCGEGVTLGSEATTFYIALPPQTFSAGFTVEIEATDGHVMEKSLEKEITIERNHIQPMSALKYRCTTPQNNEIWYTNGSTTEATQLTKPNAFNANIVSNLYDTEKECWVIKFDSEVANIGDSAFYSSNIISVNIPDSVTTIGRSAFFHCSSLTSINIPDSVTTIGDSAFYYCGGLTSITIPNSVTTIGSYAFANCYSLTCVTIPESVTKIKTGTFQYCSGITSVTIPGSITEIGSWAFCYCSSLTCITIPENVTTIGVCAFEACNSLTEFRGKFAEDNGMSLVVDGTLIAFATACGATEYTIHDSVTAIGNYAFYGCSSLTSVTIPESVTLIGDTAFGMCKSLENITIPKSVTTIHNWAFYGCNNLTSATIGEGVTAIGEGVFAYCYNLAEFKGKYAADNGRCLMKDNTIFAYANASGTEYTIPDGVSVIEKSAFRGCTDLVTVTIPSGITTINVNAFLHCDSLMEVYCKPTTPPSAIYYSNHWNAFPFNDSAQKIYVPVGSGNTYKSAPGWSEYADAIVEYEF